MSRIKWQIDATWYTQGMICHNKKERGMQFADNKGKI
jgi:hypothetical protein